MKTEMGYGIKDLKKQYKELREVGDSTLAPLLQAILDRFLALSGNYGITDWKEVEDSRLMLVVDGKINEMQIATIDIDVEDREEFWYMAYYIRFEGPTASKLYQAFQEFVRQQKLTELKRAAAELLREGKTYHLASEMWEFYSL